MSTSGTTCVTAFPARRPLFYYITDRRQLQGRNLEEHVRAVVNWGVDFVQVREKDMKDRTLYGMVRRIVVLSRRTGCRIIVSGRPDIALAAGAHGVHLPSDSWLMKEIRSWLPRRMLVGQSAHSYAEAKRAEESGADYVLLSPVFAPESKGINGPPLGLAQLERACASLKVPVLALGGMRTDRMAGAVAAGAAGIAAISLFQRDFGKISGLQPHVLRRELSTVR